MCDVILNSNLKLKKKNKNKTKIKIKIKIKTENKIKSIVCNSDITSPSRFLL